MADITAYERYVGMLVRHIREDPYPSSMHMDLVESLLPRELIGPYVEMLVDKIESERYPSVNMLQRIQRLVAQAA